MRDEKVSLPRIELLHPKVRKEILDTIKELESKVLSPRIAIRIVQGLRTIEEQNELYAQGRTKPGKIVSNAKGGSSFHNYGFAIDFALLYDKDNNGTFETLSWDTQADFDKNGKKEWSEVVAAFKAKGFVWGGDFKSIKDNPHFEKSFGFSWQQLLKKYENKEFIKGTKYVLIP